MNVQFYYPGWVRKSIAFTIDDGNTRLDKKFIDYVSAAGIKGTFNLITPLSTTVPENVYKELYADYEIANHCRYHAYPFTDGRKYDIRQESFQPETADPECIYPSGEDGIYRIKTYAWCYIADDEHYMQCVDSCQKKLESLFPGKRIKGYVWPCGEQKNAHVFEMLKAYGFQSIRKTGCVKDSTGFAPPADRMRWSYNADYTCLSEVSALYGQYPDDGELKFFCFGVHSHDFENNGAWNVLEKFCNDFGNRRSEYWYAGVGEIFDYLDAVDAVRAGGDLLKNPTPIDIYVTVDGERRILKAGC